MTLLVADARGSEAWMVADSAITDPMASLRERLHRPKITPLGGRSLVGFAGNPDLAERIIVAAGKHPVGVPALNELLRRQIEFPSVDLAYAFLDGDRARLFRITNGYIMEMPTLHLGSDRAFREFQWLRHDTGLDHSPDAVITLMMASKTPRLEAIPAIEDAVIALWRWFASTSERDVGGWVTPYVLSLSGGAELCSYAYSSSDPIVNTLAPGQVLPHGTASSGGFGFSLTSLGEAGDMVAYWLQQPGGYVVLIKDGAYQLHAFEGEPSRFKASVRDKLGFDVDLWFSDGRSTGNVISTNVLNDQFGRPRFAVVRREDGTLSLVWLQSTPDSFCTEGSIDLVRR